MTDITRRLRSSDVFNAPMTVNDTMVSPAALMAADEIDRLRAALDLIATMRPPIPQDAEGYGPSWEQYIYTRTWALFAASLQDTARAALGGER
jgi:hypothetical protein